jgi:parallel beta-helix repeat protein
MRTRALLTLAAGFALPLLACRSSSSSATPDSGPATHDAGDAKAKTDAAGDAHADAKTDAKVDAKSDASTGPDGAMASNPCTGVVGTCVPIIEGETESNIITTFAMAQANTTLAFGPGTFEFTNTITLVGVPHLTVKGAGIDKTILDFKNQTAGADGFDAQSSNQLTLFALTLQNSKGNAFKVVSSTDVIFESVKAAWTDGSVTSNGPYGIYPVTVTNLLIDGSVVTGASDSGIYVGQCQGAVVSNNQVFGNVAGIEIENTWDAEVHDNDSHDNTAGILVFDLPNLPQQGGHDVRVFNNQVVSNNQANFGANGDIVSKVPAGIGVLVMANHDVEVLDNTVTDNRTAGIAVASYLIAQIPITDATYYPYPYDISVHDNTITGTGTNPDTSVNIGLLVAVYKSTFPGMHGPDLFWDGEVDTTRMPDGGTAANPMDICFMNNASATFVDFNLPQFVEYGGDGGVPAPPDGGLTNLPSIDSFDITPFTCAGVTAAPVDAGVVFSDAGI